MSEKECVETEIIKKYENLAGNPEVPVAEVLNTYKKDVKTEFHNAKEITKAKKERRAAVAIRLKELRKESQKTQKEVAEKTGINEMTLAGYEGNRAEPHIEALVRLADVYRVSLDYVLCRTDTKEDFAPEEYQAKDEERRAVNERLQQLEKELSTIKNALK